jgi:hypothetical protein
MTMPTMRRWPRPARRLVISSILLLALLLGALPAGVASTPTGRVRNVQVSHSSFFDLPLQFTLNPTNLRNLLIGTSELGCQGPDVFNSTNGGLSWQDHCLYISESAGGQGTAVTFDSQGKAYLATLACCSPPLDVDLSTSTDGGQTWSLFRDVYTSPWGGGTAMMLLADRSPSSPYNGNLYLLIDDTAGVTLLVSTDHGQTWHPYPIVQPTGPEDNTQYPSMPPGCVVRSPSPSAM